jgi:hypothetical protein
MSLLRRIEKGGSGGSGGSGDAGNPESGGPDESKLAAMRQRRQVVSDPNRPGGRGSDNSYMDLKVRVQNKLLSELDQSMDVNQKAQVRTHIEELFNSILADESLVLSRNDV